MSEKITFNADEKFDIQLKDALVAERRLAEIFVAGDIRKQELKTETWLWEQSGNICIEYMRDRKPSGLSVCEAGYWVHELRRDGRTLLYLMFPLDDLKALCRQAIKDGNFRHNAGDDHRQSVVLLPIRRLLPRQPGMA